MCSQISLIFLSPMHIYDDRRNIYYNIPIFIFIDTQILNPAMNQVVYQQLRARFAQIPINPTSNLTFQVIDPNLVRTYRVALGFKFYLNFKLNLNNIKFVTDFIKQAFERTNTSNDQY